jgi:hypothetical protein
LTVIYSAECTAPKAPSRPAAVLPLLVVLFIVSYGILTMLVFEQGQTIESQRSLIREMLKDSTQLAALKDKQARDDSKRVRDKASVPAEQRNMEPSNPAAGAKAPDAKALDKETKRHGKSTHSTGQVPEKKPAGDFEDVRRSTRII